MQTVHLLARALRVFTLDPELSAYLKANDPQALSQAVEALATSRPASGTRWARQGGQARPPASTTRPGRPRPGSSL